MPLRKLEQFLTDGLYLQAKREADRLLLMDDLDLAQRCQVELGACKAAVYLTEVYAAAKHGERALALAEQLRNQKLIATAHYKLGIAYVHVGDSFMAEEHLKTFLGMAGSAGDAEQLRIAKANYNMSRVLRQRRDYKGAISSLAAAEPLFTAKGEHRLAAICHLDIAWCLLMAGEPDPASPHLTALESYLKSHDDPVLAADLLCGRALYFRLKGDLLASANLCEEVFQPGRLGVTDHQLSEAAWIMGENMLQLGRPQEAQIFANMALEHAVKTKWPLGMNLACNLRKRLLSQTAAGA